MRYRDHRWPADTAVRVTYDDEIHNVDLVNISSNGARIEHLEPLPEGSLVTICYLNIRLPARVVRSSDAETGVRFVTSLSAADLSVLRGAKGRHSGSWGASSHQGFRELS